MTRTAIIVNSRGEAFVGWRSGCSIGVSGCEEYYTIASFTKARTILHPRLTRDNNREFLTYWPYPDSKRLHYTADKPYVFSNRKTAEKAMQRMRGMLGRIAVVD